MNRWKEVSFWFPIGLALLTLMVVDGFAQHKGKRINGVSFVSPPDQIDSSHFTSLQHIHSNSISLMPYALGDTVRAALFYDQSWQWWGETEKGIREMIRLARGQGASLFLKPQIWMRHGTYTGSFDARDKWEVFEAYYEEYLVTFARLAELEQVEYFCIGTEMDLFVKERPHFWTKLIKQVRTEYSGKLTYAANWDNYQEVPFWDQLDYVGIDAYFPLSDQVDPTVSELIALWQPWKSAIKQLADSVNKPVLFCEFGYRSRNYTTKEPWDSERKGEVNLDAQKVAYQALFQSFWQEPWFSGGYLWKWFPNHEQAGGVNNNRFTPQNKPATEVIRKWYSK